MALQNIKAFVWDMDGTLLDTLDDIVGAVNATLRAWQLPERSKGELLRYIGYGARHLCRGASGLEGDELTHFLTEYRQTAVLRDDPTTKVYPGIETILREGKKRGIRQGVYTNKPQKWCTKLAGKFFGEDVFDIITGMTESGILKPDPAGIANMCAAWKLDPREVVMIGDSPVDWETSVRAQCRGICVTWGFRTREVLAAAGAEIIVDDPDSLRRMLGI